MVDKFSRLKNLVDKFICGPCMCMWAWAPLIALTIWGLVSVDLYRKERYELSQYTNTSCRLLRYSYSVGSCEDYGEYRYSKYKCYYEQFDVGHYVSSGNYTYGTIRINESRQQHPNQQIGRTYQCFYKGVDATSVKWDVSTGRCFLIQFLIAVALFIINIWLIRCICSWQYKEYQ
ncbi:unnamed protein product [Rotaria magnacalcarata]|uniref:Uncharacterized protein n=2 Tax=Rotaria magnacalcarata TaxID=392030 RepID=A0A816YWT5_9BILA|nr:unnamed protein product [Rotaria magnacalcarata]